MYLGIIQFFSTLSNCDPNKTFFGLPVWYKYLKTTTDIGGACNFDALRGQESLLSGLILIALAVIEILLRIAGLVAVFYIVWGGIQYVISQGEPDKTANAQSTVLNALIGLAIAIIAIGFVSFLGNKLGP